MMGAWFCYFILMCVGKILYGNHQQAEIDVIAIDVTDRQAKIFEVKRN